MTGELRGDWLEGSDWFLITHVQITEQLLTCDADFIIDEDHKARSAQSAVSSSHAEDDVTRLRRWLLL